jgi:pimeloyl-ACP methyl ester carboxylesterase
MGYTVPAVTIHTDLAYSRFMSTAKAKDGNVIRYDVMGRGEPTLVLVHGWALDRHLWDNDVPRLAARYRVVTLDLPGHGQSSGTRAEWTIAAFGDDVKAVVEAVGATDVVLVGHSMGGPVVLEAARRMPDRVRGIVLVDTILDAEARTPTEQIETLAQQLQTDYRHVAAQMTSEYLFVSATPLAVRERVLQKVAALPPDVSIALLKQAWAYSPLAALREIKAPVRAVNADKFPTNLEANRRHMPGYEAQIVPGSGHYPMLETPQPFAAALDRALEQVIAAGGKGRTRSGTS